MNVFLQSLLSGIIAFILVFLTTLATVLTSPAIGAVIWSLPCSVFSTVLVMYISHEDSSKSYKLLYGTSSTMISLFVLMIIWAICLEKKWFKESRVKNMWLGFLLSMIGWAVCTTIFLSLVYNVTSIKNALF